MAKKTIMFKGISENELKKLSLKEFMEIANSRTRRSLKRGFRRIK